MMFNLYEFWKVIHVLMLIRFQWKIKRHGILML